MKAAISRHIKDNKKKYLLFSSCLVIGVVLGLMAPRFLSKDIHNELNTFISQYFSDYGNIKTIDSDLLFQNNLFKEISIYLLIWISGFTVIGSFFIPAYFLFYGFVIGFTNSFINTVYGLNGFLMNFASLLPQNIIKIPALFFAGICVVSYSQKHTKTSKGLVKAESNKGLFSVYTIFLLSSLFVSVLGVAVESYVTPGLIIYFVEKMV